MMLTLNSLEFFLGCRSDGCWALCLSQVYYGTSIYVLLYTVANYSITFWINHIVKTHTLSWGGLFYFLDPIMATPWIAVGGYNECSLESITGIYEGFFILGQSVFLLRSLPH